MKEYKVGERIVLECTEVPASDSRFKCLECYFYIDSICSNDHLACDVERSDGKDVIFKEVKSKMEV